MRERQHCRVCTDDFCQLQVFFHHVRVGNVGSGLGGAECKSSVLNRKEALGYEDVADHRKRQGQAEHAEHQSLMGQRLTQASLVGSQQTFTEARLLMRVVRGGAHEQCRKGWRQGQGDDHRNQDGCRGGQGEFLEQPPDHAAHEQQRNERRHQRETDRHHSKTDFPRALYGGLARALSGFKVAMDVLHHHDSVVHHEPDRDHDGYQCQVVQAEAEQVHHRKAGDQRYPEHRADDQRGRQLAQKQRHDRHHQQHCDHQGQFHFVQRGTNGAGPVVEYRDLNGGREHFLQPWQFTLNAVHGVDNVGARLTKNSDVDALLVAGPGLDVGVFRTRDHPRHILELDGGAVLVGNDQLRVVLRLEQLVVGRQCRNAVLAV